MCLFKLFLQRDTNIELVSFSMYCMVIRHGDSSPLVFADDDGLQPQHHHKQHEDGDVDLDDNIYGSLIAGDAEEGGGGERGRRRPESSRPFTISAGERLTPWQLTNNSSFLLQRSLGGSRSASRTRHIDEQQEVSFERLLGVGAIGEGLIVLTWLIRCPPKSRCKPVLGPW